MSAPRGIAGDPGMATKADDSAGHRFVTHTADTILEAWGPDREACLREAIMGTVAGFADIRGVNGEASVSLFPGVRGDTDTLVYLLEEVIYSVEVGGMIPVAVTIEDKPPDGLCVLLRLARLKEARIVGPLPKGVSWHELSFAPDPSGSWRARVLLDV